MRPTQVGLFGAPVDIPSYSMTRYAESLTRALRELNDERFSVQEVRPGPARLASRFFGHTTPFRYWVRYPRYLAAAHSSRFSVNHILDHGYGHLVHALDARRTIVTCHDLFPLLHWRGAIAGLPRRRKRPISVEVSVRALRRARFVVAVSHATRRDLVDIVGVAPENIHVVPSGIDRLFQPLDVEARRKASLLWQFGRPATKRVLCIDTGVPYKNTLAVLETFARVRARLAPNLQLVRVGPPLPPDLLLVARRGGIENAIWELGSVPEAQMPLLYNSCDVLLFPSFYEGFGWPPLEAMACGLPVVTSRAPALLEMAGPAAVTADAQDYDKLAAHVCCLLEDDGEAHAARARGLAHAKTFPWRRTAKAISDLYGAILEEAS